MVCYWLLTVNKKFNMNTTTTQISQLFITITFFLLIVLLGTNSVLADVPEPEPEKPEEPAVKEINFYEIPVVTDEQKKYIADTYGMSPLHLVQERYRSLRDGKVNEDRLDFMYEYARYLYEDIFDPIWMKQINYMPTRTDIYLKNFVDSFKYDLIAYGIIDRDPNGPHLAPAVAGKINSLYKDDNSVRARLVTFPDAYSRDNILGYNYNGEIIINRGRWLENSEGWKWSFIYHQLGHFVLGYDNTMSASPSLMDVDRPWDDDHDKPVEFLEKRAELFKHYIERRGLRVTTPVLPQMSIWWNYSNNNKKTRFIK